ncbi:hemerythrin domain-containing protein [Streptosporangiaceae bacterium NEAU-GS5]|nr:hemerythrin domain-containing protein [Streptosporangiaceae bacterium NEAU-GS5]
MNHGADQDTVFDVLARDHAEVKRMIAELRKGAPSAGDVDALTLRGKMVEQLIIEESKHEALEEQYVWPAVRQLIPGGDALADIATRQEQAAKELLDELMDVDPGDARFEALLTSLATDGLAHMAFEEERVWPQLREVIGAERARELGHKIAEGKAHAPTRPHPRTPASEAVQKAAGPIVGAMDRARDKLTGRDQD